jgi:hypothetical protein
MAHILLMAQVQRVARLTISLHCDCHRKSSWTIIPKMRCLVFTSSISEPPMVISAGKLYFLERENFMT